MPTSDYSNILPICNSVAKCNPKSILDLGCGFGKYGVLLREMMDIQAGRIDPKDWQVEIIGVEGFSEYQNAIHKNVYTTVWYEDFTEKFDEYFGYDVVLMIDSLEHVDMKLGHTILTYLIQNNKHVIVSCPYGENYLEQGAVNGNELERHKAHWKPEQFERMGGKIIYKGVCAVAYFKGQGM